MSSFRCDDIQCLLAAACRLPSFTSLAPLLSRVLGARVGNEQAMRVGDGVVGTGASIEFGWMRITKREQVTERVLSVTANDINNVSDPITSE